MVGRPKTFDNDTAIKAFVDVFWSRGYDATSIDDLQDAVGIKRGSFYAAFGNKENAFIAAMERYVEDVTATVAGKLDENPDPRSALAGMLRQLGAFMVGNPGRGCFLLTSVAEPIDLSPKQGQKLQELAGYVVVRVADKAKKFVDGLDRKSGLEPEAVKSFMIANLFGLNAMARAGMDDEAILLAAETAAQFIERL